MRAMSIREHGAPSVLKLEELPVPELRETDVLVEVHATSVNPVDTKVRQRAGTLLGEQVVVDRGRLGLAGPAEQVERRVRVHGRLPPARAPHGDALVARAGGHCAHRFAAPE